jgi:hypothetical protein
LPLAKGGFMIRDEFFYSEKVQLQVTNIIEQAQQVIETRSGRERDSSILDEAINNLINAKSKEGVIHYYQQLKMLLNRMI